MRGLSDSDIHNESTGETMAQYWKRRDLEYIKTWVEWGVYATVGISVIVLTFTVF